MKKLLFFLLLASGIAFAQNTRVVPDCTIQFDFTAAGSTGTGNCGTPNFSGSSQPGIAFWVLNYYSSGFSGLTITVQSAADSSGSPGSWGTFGGTVLTSTQLPGSSGANPNTATTSAFTGLAGYFPWMRVNLSGLTGSGEVKGALFGYLNSTIARAGSGGGGGGPTIAGTTNQIVVTGTGCSGAGTCTISFPNASVTIDPSTGNFSTPGTVKAGISSGTTGALDLVGKTSGATSTVTVDDSNTATTVKLPNDSTSGLYGVTTASATPAAGCAQFNGTSTEIGTTGSPCGSGGGGGANISTGTFAGIPSCTSTQFLYLVQDSYYQSIYCNGSSTLSYFRDGKQLTLPPAAGSWTVVAGDSGTSAVSNSKGAVVLSTTASVEGIEGAFVSIPSTPYTTHFALSAANSFTASGSTGTIIWCGVMLTNGISTSSSVQMARFFFTYDTSGTIPFSVMQVAHYTNFTYSGGVGDATFNGPFFQPAVFYFEISDNGTTRVLSFSNDGENYLTLFSEAHTSPFTPTNYGFGCGGQNNTSGLGAPWLIANLGTF